MASSGDRALSDRERPGKDGIKVSGPISVLIAEDSLLVRDSVCRALSTDADVTVVGVAEDYDSTVELVEKHQPTMLLTDVRMPPTSTDEGIRLARWMRTAHPDTGVIVLPQYPDRATRRAQLREELRCDFSYVDHFQLKDPAGGAIRC